MHAKKPDCSAEWTDPDDAPEITDAMVDTAEFYEADTFIRQGRGRPKLGSPKQQISVRPDAKF